MAKHHPDLIFCRKQAGVAIGRLCEKCDGKCVICDSYVRPCTLVRICDECNYGSYQGRCVICGGPGVSDAYYCKECTIQEKDRQHVHACTAAPARGAAEGEGEAGSQMRRSLMRGWIPGSQDPRIMT
ncbi:PHD finger-like domain-containing protein 5A isoform X1 [Ursus arctos]|uniref:PHD finger-like domain-containing protein 5A isoform X1 n=1 Tax=Ursus arctos TaxID=9644 RepID=UPI0025492756|nr:PHD finger-like domain-containing protein 5A isoform X1 [Ursus arctos]